MKNDIHAHSELERDDVMCRTVQNACGLIQGRRISESGGCMIFDTVEDH